MGGDTQLSHPAVQTMVHRPPFLNRLSIPPFESCWYEDHKMFRLENVPEIVHTSTFEMWLQKRDDQYAFVPTSDTGLYSQIVSRCV